MIPCISGLSSNQIHGNRKWISGCHGLRGGGNEELLFNGYTVSVFKDGKILEINCIFI